MRKIITLFLLFSLLFSMSGIAQRRISNIPVKKNFTKLISRKSSTLKNTTQFNFLVKKAKTVSKQSKVLAAGDCAVIDPPFEDETVLGYLFDYDSGDQAPSFTVGTNDFDDLQKAQFLDFSSAPVNNYLNGVFIDFAYVESGDSDVVVPIRVYDGTSGEPGTELGHTDITLRDIAADVDDGYSTYIPFTNIHLPASKKVFISIDMNNLYFYGTDENGLDGDHLGVYSSDFDSTAYNQAWEQWSDGSWYPFTDVYSYDADGSDPGSDGMVSIAMFPIVGVDATCTQFLPVKLTSFNAQKFGSANKLQWNVASELNNKGYELESSANGTSFSSITYIVSKTQGGNSTGALTYSFVDNNPVANKTYYRLKQIDINGKITYSKIVLVSRDATGNEGIVQVYPNPVSNALNLVLDLPVNKAASLTVSDVTGKILLSKTLTATGVNQTVPLNVTSLAKGTYFVRLIGEGSNKITRFIKK